MRRFYLMVSAMTLLTMTLTACGGTSTSTPTQVPANEPPATTVPVTQAPIVADTATTAPIDLAGPPMEVGSTYQYIDGSILVAIPGGEFIMGSGGIDNPEHKVTLSDFWIYRAKVTNKEYAACVAAGNCAPPDLNDNKAYTDLLRGSNPVVGVNWDQANAYCSWVHGRLPTEAEWEKTARGPDGNIFPWGDATAACNLLNYKFCVGKTTDVTKYVKGKSYYDALDMAGNAFEWVSDWYKLSYYGEAPLQDPLGPEIGEKRSVRGSSFGTGADESLSAHRFSMKPIEHRADLGFRCVVEDPTFFAPFCKTTGVYGMTPDGLPTGDKITDPNNCPQPSLNLGVDCKSQATYVTIDPWPLPVGATISIPGNCTGGPPTYKCVGSGNISITPEDCPVPPPPSGTQCNLPYTPGPNNTCVGKGNPGQCPTGYSYDSASQCCTAQGAGDSLYNVCPPGFFKQGNACIPAGSNPKPPQPAQANFSPVDPCPGQTHQGGGCDPSASPGDPNACPIEVPGCTNVTTCVPGPNCPRTNPNCICTTTCQ